MSIIHTKKRRYPRIRPSYKGTWKIDQMELIEMTYPTVIWIKEVPSSMRGMINLLKKYFPDNDLYKHWSWLVKKRRSSANLEKTVKTEFSQFFRINSAVK